MLNKLLLPSRIADAVEPFGMTGRTFAILSLATQSAWKDANEEWQRRVEWHRLIVIWNLNFPSIGVSASLICTNPVE